MKNRLNQYKLSSLFAMGCGLVTAVLGIYSISAPKQEGASLLAVSVTMVLNTVLHFESYFATLKRENRRQPNVLSMAIAEAVLLFLFAVCLCDPQMGWRDFSILFSVYLVFNGASLIVIPAVFARNCGIAATVLGAAIYFFGKDFGTCAAILTGVNLIVNGLERIFMAAMGGKKRK